MKHGMKKKDDRLPPPLSSEIALERDLVSIKLLDLIA